jgi:hypothetical protein
MQGDAERVANFTIPARLKPLRIPADFFRLAATPRRAAGGRTGTK